MRISDWSSDVCSSDLLLVFTGRKHRQEFGLQPESDRLELADNFFALGRKEYPPDPPVGRIRPSFEKLCFLKAVDHPAQGDAFDLKQIRKHRLRFAGIARQQQQKSPLWPRHAQRAGFPVEPIAHQPRHVVQKKTKITVVHYCKLAYIIITCNKFCADISSPAFPQMIHGMIHRQSIPAAWLLRLSG